MMVAAGLATSVGAYYAAPFMLAAAGFGSTGIVFGSVAASIHSYIGNVAAGLSIYYILSCLLLKYIRWHISIKKIC